MKKLDRFLLAENPMRDGGIAIIHTVDPVAIIGVIEGWHEPKQHYMQGTYYPPIGENQLGIAELYTLYIHHYFTTNMALLDEEAGKEAMTKLLDRARHWYEAYLEWADKNIDESEQSNLN